MNPHCRIAIESDAQAVSSELLYMHLRLDCALEDVWLQACLAAATDQAQGKMNRQLLQATRELTLARWPKNNGPVKIPFPPLQEISSVEYLDTDGNTQTLDASDWHLDNTREASPAMLYPAPGTEWPDTLPDHPGAVTITFVCGYPQSGSPAVAVLPQAIAHWILLRVEDLYEHRGTYALVNGALSLKEAPRSRADGLLDKWIVWEAA